MGFGLFNNFRIKVNSIPLKSITATKKLKDEKMSIMIPLLSFSKLLLTSYSDFHSNGLSLEWKEILSASRFFMKQNNIH